MSDLVWMKTDGMWIIDQEYEETCTQKKSKLSDGRLPVNNYFIGVIRMSKYNLEYTQLHELL